MKSKRLKYIDVAKGIATLCVILGHMSITPKSIVNEVYSFHIPLFFFLSGMVMNFDKYHTFIDYLKDKTKKVLIPYLTLSLLIWVWVALIKQDNPLNNFYTIHSFIGIFLCAKDTPYYLSLWFVLSLYISQLVLYFAVKGRSQLFQIACLTVSFVLAIWISIIYKPGWIFATDTVPMALCFLGAGFVSKKYLQESSRLLKFGFLFLSVPMNLITYYFNFTGYGRSDLFYQNIGNPLLYIMSAFAGIWTILLISKLIQNSKIFNFVGMNSLVFYALHRPFFFSVGDKVIQYIRNVDFAYIHNKFFLTFIFMVIVCICLSLSAVVINKFFPFLIGKRYQKKEII